MRLGLVIFPTAATIQPTDLGVAAEGLGFESLWFPEHSHIPTSRESPWGGRRDAPPLPDYYSRSYDQFVALGAVAAVTSTLRLGTAITLVAQHDHLWLAKQVATLDTISGGRFLFGIGYGWNKEEMAHHGVRYGERRALVKDKVQAMRALWTEEAAAYDGEHVRFTASWAWPKPVQAPHPPIILGGSPGPKTFADVVSYCDGWMPIQGRCDIVAAIATLREAATEAGRNPDALEITVFGAPPDVAALEELAAAGVSRALLRLPDASAAEHRRTLDRWAPLLTRFHG